MPLHVSKDAKTMAFSFEEGQEMKEHSSSKQAILVFMSGKATVTLGDDSVNVQAGSWIHIPPYMQHSITAHAATVLLLVLVPDTTNT